MFLKRSNSNISLRIVKTRITTKRNLILIFCILSILVLSLFSNPLYAQRTIYSQGKDTSLRYNPIKDFSGFFDANMPRPHSLLIHAPTIVSGGTLGTSDSDDSDDYDESEDSSDSDSSSSSSYSIVPYFNIDYGINKNLAIGTNLVTFMPFFMGGIGGSIKARTKVYEGQGFMDVFTTYVGGGYFEDDEGLKNSFNYLMLSNASRFSLGPRSSLTLFSHFWSFYFDSVQFDQTMEEHDEIVVDLLTSFVGFTYHYYLPMVALSATMVIPFYLKFAADTLTYRAALDTLGIDLDLIGVRLGADVLLGKKSLVSIGAGYMSNASVVLDAKFMLWLSYSQRIDF